MKRIKVTGFIEIEDEEFDPGVAGPLTEKAWMRYWEQFHLEDLSFEVAE